MISLVNGDGFHTSILTNQLSRTLRPGSSRPAISSKLAPPPVLTQLNLSCRPLSSIGHHPFDFTEKLGFNLALADGMALSSHKGVGHSTTNHQAIDVLDQIIEHRQLGRDLGSGYDRDQRLRGVLESLGNVFDFF